MKKLLPLLLAFTTLAAFGQNELTKQLNLVKELLPEATRCAVFYNTGDQRAPSLINMASQETELTIVQAPCKNVREMSTAMRQLKQYDVDFYVVIDDRIVAGPSALKFLVKQANKANKAVFSSSENSFNSGAFGRFAKKGNVWYVEINGKVDNLYGIVVPSDNVNYVVQN